MEPYFIVSFSAVDESPDRFKQAQSMLSSVETFHLLHIPELRVGTLDNLLTIADSAVKTDQYIQQTSYKIEKQLVEFSKDKTNPQIDGSFNILLLSLFSSFIYFISYDNCNIP